MKKIAILLCLVFMVGCSNSKVTGYTDPAYKNTTFHRIMIDVDEEDLSSKLEAEKAFVAKLKKAGVDAVPFTSIFPPTRVNPDLSGKEFQQKLQASGIEAVLYVKLSAAYTNEQYVEKSTTTKGSVKVENGKLKYYKNTREHGGYYISTPVNEHRIELVDVRATEIKTVWIGDSITRGSNISTRTGLFKALASKVARELSQQKLIPGQHYKR